MKLHGKKLSGPNVVQLILSRPDGPICIMAQGITSTKEFDDLMPQPKPPMRLKPGGEQIPDFKDQEFIQKMEHYGKIKTDWIILKSLSVTPGLEWEKVDFKDFGTLHLWQEELAESFSEPEVVKITRLAMEANGLDEEKLEAARKHFLALESQQAKS